MEHTNLETRSLLGEEVYGVEFSILLNRYTLSRTLGLIEALSHKVNYRFSKSRIGIVWSQCGVCWSSVQSALTGKPLSHINSDNIFSEETELKKNKTLDACYNSCEACIVRNRTGGHLDAVCYFIRAAKTKRLILADFSHQT